MNLTLQQYRLWQMAQTLGPWFWTDNAPMPDTPWRGIPAYDSDKGDWVSQKIAAQIQSWFNSQLGITSSLRIDPRTKSYDGVNERWLLDYTNDRGEECTTAIGDIRAEMCDPFAWMFEKYESTYWVGIDAETAMPAMDAQGQTRGQLAWCAPRSNGLTFEYFPDRRKTGERPPNH